MSTSLSTTNVSVSGNDVTGTITISVQAGADALPSGDQLALVFKNSYSKSPRVTLTSLGASSAGLGIYVSDQTTDGFTMGTSNNVLPGQTYRFNYFVVQ